MSWEAALSEIGRCRGTQFEPRLTEAFVLLMQADFEKGTGGNRKEMRA